MDQRELPSDSDESDEDYVPSGAESNPPSEEESDGNEEPNEDASEEELEEKGKRKRSSKKLKNKTAKRRRKNKLASKNNDKEEVKEVEEEQNEVTEEEEKKKADSLWSDFLKDTGSVSKPKKETSLPNGKSESTVTKQEENKERENKVTITKVYEFAGEEVKVTKEVPVDSVEAKTAAIKPQSTSVSPVPAAGRGQGKARGGLSSVLGLIGNKKQKLGTLEKSKLDWDRFKRAEGIEEELQTHNRGRDGYLDKLDFLQRTDLRQFELEKQLRTSRRSNR